MPVSAPKKCRHPGCRVLVRGAGYCDAHSRPAPGSFADARRGNRHARGYGGQWDKLRIVILKRDGGLCQACLRQGHITPIGHRPFTAYVDHVVPKCDGGTDDLDNLQSLCKACHDAKTNREKHRRRAKFF